MAVLFWYLENSDDSVLYYAVAYIGQVTFYKVPEQNGHVKLVNLYTLSFLGSLCNKYLIWDLFFTVQKYFKRGA